MFCKVYMLKCVTDILMTKCTAEVTVVLYQTLPRMVWHANVLTSGMRIV